MIEQPNNPLAETQKIEIDQEAEDIRQIQDGNDLLFWVNELEEIDYKVEVIRGINQDPELAGFLSNTGINLFADNSRSLQDFVDIVEKSQNKKIKIKVGQLISNAYGRKIRAKHGIN